MKAEQKITYGLFVVTVRDGKRDSGCICNTLMQVTTSPNRVSLTLNKENYTTELLAKTGVFNVSILSEEADFSLFERFGFQSGRDTDKFADFPFVQRTKNEHLAVTQGSCAWLSGRVVQQLDLGSHILFIADVADSGMLGEAPPASYAYYHAHIKPRPGEKKTEETLWRCRICGYEYTGAELPADFVCPLCKHGAEDFEKA